MKRIFVGLALAIATAAGYAQWSNPADDVPAYHASAPAPGQKLAPILSGKQLTGQFFQYKWQVIAYKEAAQI
jgi:hypothetical protein